MNVPLCWFEIGTVHIPACCPVTVLKSVQYAY